MRKSSFVLVVVAFFNTDAMAAHAAGSQSTKEEGKETLLFVNEERWSSKYSTYQVGRSSKTE
jgi:hypothetical protein